MIQKGENKAAIHVANTTSDRQVKEAEAQRKATTAKNVAVAKAQEDSYSAEQKAEEARAKKEEATLYANQVVPAEIEKKKVTIDAEYFQNKLPVLNH